MERALFLDRDGVINEDCGYCYQPKHCVFVDGIFDLTQKAQENGYLVIVITNQSGIARGYYSESEFLEFTLWIERQFKLRGITITQTYHCPHHPDHAPDRSRQEFCKCRKPQPGMILEALSNHEISAEQSILVGDNISDMDAAFRAGIGKKVLVSAAKSSNYEDFRAASLRDVTSFLFGKTVLYQSNEPAIATRGKDAES